jgi:hypothetical protein
MKYLKTIIASVAAAGLLLALAPVFAQAQQYYNYCNNGYAIGNYNCAPGTLQVYVQVTGNVVNGVANNPADFTVVVSGINPAPATFQGSLSGTPVSVAGAYTVVADQVPGYTPSYSQGCQGTLGAGQQASCIITESSGPGYYSYPTPYPYPYYQPQLSCAPAQQTVGFGQTATFTALGGTGPYTWVTANQTYQNIGPTLNVVLPVAGTQAVTVHSGAQTATCTVTVAGSVYTPGVVSVNQPPYVPGATIAVISPKLPNTGFAPQNGAALAFAVAALLAVSIAVFPYVRATVTALLA